MKRNLKTVAQLSSEGTFSADQLRWMIFNAKSNGLESAICRIGRRVYIDEDAFDEWLVAQNPALKTKAGGP